MTTAKNTKNIKPNTVGAIKKEHVLMLVGVLVIVTFFSFYPSLKNNFINWDDNAHIFENQILAKSFPEAAKYFFGQHTVIGNYIPLTMMVYFIEHHFAGLNPKVFHAVNLIFHLLNVLLVFWFTFLLSRKKLNIAFIVALFFGIHPMHVESVAWVSALKDLLYSFFFLLGLIFYCKYLIQMNDSNVDQKQEKINQTPTSKNIFFSIPISVLILFILSLLSKPAAIVFPFVLVAIDFYNNRKFDKWIWLEKTPYFLLSILFGFIAYKAQAADRLLHDYFSLFHKLLFACHSYLLYIAKFFFPTNLSIFYPYPSIEKEGLSLDFYIAPIAVLILLFFVFRSLKKTKVVFFGFLFFTIKLILVLQLVTIGEAIFAERYSYLSYIGLFFIAASGIDSLHEKIYPRIKVVQKLLVVFIALLALTCSYITNKRCKVWNNDDSLATDLLEKYPNDRLALNNKGFILMEQGKHLESIDLFKKALQIRPDYLMASINLTNAYLALNNFDAAISNNDSALVYSPNDHNLLNNKAYFLFQQKKYNEAIVFYKQALSKKKDAVNVYINLAECYYTIKDYENVISTLESGLKYAPDNYILLNSRGYMFFLNENYDEALKYYNAALRINPGYETASVNLKNCYQALKLKSK